MRKLKKLITDLREADNWQDFVFHSSWTLTFAYGTSYVLGFFRDRIFAHTFGLSRTLDVYNAAFVIPDLMLSVLIGTALSAAFLPIFTRRYDEKKELGYQYAHQMLSYGVTLMVGVGVAVAITLPWWAHHMVPGFEPDALKQYITITRIMLLSPLLFTISNIYGRILLSMREFVWFGFAPALYNLGIVMGAAFLVPRFGLTGLVAGTVTGVLINLIFRLIGLKRKHYHFKHQVDFRFSPEMKETAVLMAPKIVQYAMWSIMLASFTGIASGLAEGSIATYNYARNFQSIPVSLLGIAIAMAAYTSLSHDAAKGHYAKFLKDFRRDRVRLIFYTTLAAIALALLAETGVRILLGGGAFDEADVKLLARVIQVYCLSVPLESLLHLYHRAYYSLLNTLIPSFFHALAILGMIVIAKTLAPQLGVFAIPVGFTGGLVAHLSILAILFPFLLRRRMKPAA